MAAQTLFTTRRYVGIGFKKRSVRGIALVVLLLLSVTWDLVKVLSNNVSPKTNTSNETNTNALTRELSIPLKYPIKVKNNQVISIKTEKLYNPGGFQYANFQLCHPSTQSNKPLKLLILVTSAPFPKNVDRRDAIRKNWGQQIQKNKIGVRLAFVLGRLNEENYGSSVQTRIKEEMKLYNDLIIGNFIDSYDNLTLKTMSLLEWTTTYCSEAQYLLKTDDDVWINEPNIFRIIERIDKENGELKFPRRIYGRLTNMWTGPYRDPKSKYFVSKKQYSNSSFPVYLYGIAYLIPGGKLVEELYVEGLKTKFLWLEDVFLTGVVADGLDLEKVHLDKFCAQRHEFGVVRKERANRSKCEIARWAVVHLLRIGKRRVSVKEELENLRTVLRGYQGKNTDNCSVYK